MNNYNFLRLNIFMLLIFYVKKQINILNVLDK